MSGSVNKVILIGNLGADPEMRRTQDGKQIANLRIATSNTWRDKNTGERKEKTEWHRVVVFNEHGAQFAEKYLKKGSKVYLEGELATRKWTDREGQDRYSTEVIYNFRGTLQSLDKAEGHQQSPDDYGTTRTRNDGPRQNNYAAAHGRPQPPAQDEFPNDGFDDDIPF